MADEAPKKDPNDPTQRLTRAEAMVVVNENRKRNLAKDQGPEENQPQATPAATATPATEPAESETSNLDSVAQVAVQLDAPVILADDELGKYQVRTRVNGEERIVPLAELRASAQKNEAADRYLREAKDLLESAKAAAKAPAPAPATPEPAAPTAAKPADVDTLVDSAIDGLFTGNEAETKRLLKEAFKGRPAETPTIPAAPNLDQLAASLEQKVVVRSALRQFAKDYPAIVGDPVARQVADGFLSELTEGKPLEAFPEDKISKILADTGARVVSWTRGLAGVPADGSATTRIDKAQRKETIDELPAASTRSSNLEPAPKSSSDVIRNMKVARGQLHDPSQR